jgi:putative methyltransferase
MSRNYLNAARAIDAVERGQSFKAFCASQPRFGKVEFALASETLKYLQVIKRLFKITGLSGDKLDVRDSLLKVMVYELLFGKGKIDSGGVVKRKLMAEKDGLLEALAKEMKSKNATQAKELLPDYVADLPKYVRINGLKVKSDVDGLTEIQKACPTADYDDTIPSLVLLPAGSKSLGEHPWVKDGRLIIQDKASCFSSQCIGDIWTHGDIIDACAAPGNKTTHMAAIVHKKCSSKAGSNKVKIFAFDKSPVRADLLQRRVVNAGADAIIEVNNQDFLTVDEDSAKFRGVTSVLVDPSCSGSGIRTVDRVTEGEADDFNPENDERLQKLRAFQIAAIQKAMSFPNVTTVVYSTCSIHIEENESVVVEVLHNMNTKLREDKHLSAGYTWTVVEPVSLKTWKRRGVPAPGLSPELQQRLIRCDPSDGLNGFFVAVFVKTTATGPSSSKSGKSSGKAVADKLTVDSKLVKAEADVGELSVKKRKAPANDDVPEAIAMAMKSEGGDMGMDARAAKLDKVADRSVAVLAKDGSVVQPRAVVSHDHTCRKKRRIWKPLSSSKYL